MAKDKFGLNNSKSLFIQKFFIENRVIMSSKWINKEMLPPIIIGVIYIGVAIVSRNYSYFWDNIQYSSITADWYYTNNFSQILLPFFSGETKIVGAGGFSFMGFTTALLWVVFGKQLWVSHIYILIWALVLIYQTFNLLKTVLPSDLKNYALLVLLLESSVLSQLAVASIDIVLITLFVLAVRAVMENKIWVLAITMTILVNLSGRGMIAGVGIVLFFICFFYLRNNESFTINLLIKRILPFTPGFVIYSLLFINIQMFNSDTESPWVETWAKPGSILEMLKNMAAFILRMTENGRFFVWGALIVTLIRAVKQKTLKTLIGDTDKPFVLVLVFFAVIYFYFAVSTKMIISTRYYLVIFFIATILLYRLAENIFSKGIIRKITIVALFLQISGHFWVYPEKVSQSWDATLAHIPFYELRKECLNFIEEKGIKYSDISAGFCFAGNQKNIDLISRDRTISNNSNNKYFIYSNISNLADEQIDELNNTEKWKVLKTFRKGYIFVSLLQKAE